MAAKYAYETLKKRKAASSSTRRRTTAWAWPTSSRRASRRWRGDRGQDILRNRQQGLHGPALGHQGKESDVLYMPNYYTEVALAMNR